MRKLWHDQARFPPLAEQRRIVAELDALQAEEELRRCKHFNDLILRMYEYERERNKMNRP